MEESKEKKVIKISFKKFIIIITMLLVVIAGAVIYIQYSNNEFYKYENNNGKNCLEENDISIGTKDKPVIYLYPKETTEVNVKLGKSGLLTCSYPKYDESGWNVIAEPSGKLTDINTDRELYCLYWEGLNTNKTNMNEGFVVEGKDTIEFLEEKLEILGLNEKEAQEFIIYWLPQMEDNKYNYIRFETIEEINENMPLEITPVPDNIIRINMQWKALDEYIQVEEQLLEKAPERTGFTVVEWGGTKID